MFWTEKHTHSCTYAHTQANAHIHITIQKAYMSHISTINLMYRNHHVSTNSLET